MVRERGKSAGRHPVLEGAPLLIAHRGGAGLAPENTMAAFRQAIDDWGVDMIELDLHATADGECVVIHDPTVDRTTDGTGRVAEMTLAELKELDAGHRFTPDGGRSHPFRGRGIRIPTIDEVLESFPGMRFTLEVKAGAAQRPLFEAIRRHGAEDRVIVAGIEESARTRFGEYGGPKSASSRQARNFYILYRLGLSRLWRAPVVAVQVPEWWRGRRVITPGLIRAIQRRGLAVHIWTVNEVEEMERLLDWGVDGILTDRPDRLADLLARRSGRPPAPARLRSGASLE